LKPQRINVGSSIGLAQQDPGSHRRALHEVFAGAAEHALIAGLTSRNRPSDIRVMVMPSGLTLNALEKRSSEFFKAWRAAAYAFISSNMVITSVSSPACTS
jgi:hypothetical protein